MKIVYRPLPVLTILVMLCGMGSAHALDVKLGVVDMAKLLQQAPQAQTATKEMEQKFNSRRKDLLAQQNKIKDMQDQINRNGAVMSAAQLQGLQNQLDNLQQDFQRKQSDYMADVNTQRNEELGKIQQAILKAVQEFAKNQNYNLIIGEGVFYADGTVDVTTQVLAQLQKDFKAAGNAPASTGN